MKDIKLLIKYIIGVLYFIISNIGSILFYILIGGIALMILSVVMGLPVGQ